MLLRNLSTACDSDFPVFTALHKSEQISDMLIFQSHFLSFLPLTEDVAAKFRLPSAPALMWNEETYVRAFLQCFAHSSPGSSCFFGAEMRRYRPHAIITIITIGQ